MLVNSVRPFCGFSSPKGVAGRQRSRPATGFELPYYCPRRPDPTLDRTRGSHLRLAAGESFIDAAETLHPRAIEVTLFLFFVVAFTY